MLGANCIILACCLLVELNSNTAVLDVLSRLGKVYFKTCKIQK
jgi:hypothetical protein